MRLTTVILIASLLQVSASTFGQRITLSQKNKPLKEVLREITRQSGYGFFYDDKTISDGQKVTVVLSNAEFDDALNSVLARLNLSYKIDGHIVSIKPKEPSLLDKITSVIQNVMKDLTVKGRVVDQDGKPLPNASIRVKGKSAVINTNQNGEFEIKEVADDAVLVISYVGYKQLEIPVKGAVMPLEIKLNQVTGELEEVNVTYNTGYQLIDKTRATGSFEIIDNKKFNEQVGTNVLSRLPAIANSLSVLPARITGSNGGTLLLRGSQSLYGPKGPLIILDNFPYNGDLNNINPNDIENITLLKDAAATSIWGAKAGNGVIVITTKKAQLNQKIKIDLVSNLTLTNKPDLFYLNKAKAGDEIEFEKILFTNGYYDPYLEYVAHEYQSPVVDILEKERKGIINESQASLMLDSYSNNDIRNDFLKYVYQLGLNQQYAVNLSGGSGNMGWRLSSGLDKNSDQLHAGYDRGTFRMDNYYKPLKKLSLSAGLIFAYSKTKNGKDGYGQLYANYNVPNYSKLVNDDGSQVPYSHTYRRSFIDTAGQGKLLDWNYYPLENYKHRIATNSIKNLIGNFAVNYEIFSGLKIDLKYRLEIQQQNIQVHNDENSISARDLINKFTTVNNQTGVINRPVPLGGILDFTNANMRSNDLRGQLDYYKSWNKHSISAIAGVEFNNRVNENESNRYYGYKDDILAVAPIDYFKTYPVFLTDGFPQNIPYEFSINKFENRFTAQYINASYSFDNKYGLSVSARKDGSNIFGVATNDRWNLLWSTGASWDISKEKFYNVDLLPNLKLKGTYGYGGNVLPNASSISTITYASAPSIFTNGQIASISNFYNPEMRWEKISTLNLRMEFGFKNNRINGSLEYFKKNGTDLYDFAPIDRTLGLARDMIQKNNSGILGKGFEFDITSKNLEGKLTWMTDLKFSYYGEKVKKVRITGNRADSYVGDNGAPAIGYPRYRLFAYKWAGLNPETGAPRGYLKGKISENYPAMVGDSAVLSDLIYKGSLTPTFFGSIGNIISFKDFSLSARFLYAFGYYFQRQTFNLDDATTRNIHSDFGNRWKKPGDELTTDIPAFNYSDDYYLGFFFNKSEVLATRADHIRLQYVNLSYSLNRNVIKKMPFSSVRVSAIANDIGIIWRANKFGIDPVSPNSIPPARSFVLSINANF